MKNVKTLRRISLIVVAVMLVTMCALGVTLARYTSTFTGSFSAETKKWNISVNPTANEDNKFTFAATDIYPGMTSKSYQVVVTNNGEVDALLDATLSVADGGPANLKIEMDKAYNDVSLKVGNAVTITITVSWAYGEDVDDTADAGKAVSFTLNVTAEQVKASA